MTSLSKEELRFRAAGFAGGLLVRSLFTSTRFRVEGEGPFLRLREAGQPVILVCWHGHLLPLIYHHRGRGMSVLVSEHKDGEYITRIMMGLGFEAARGSSTRGGAAGLKGLVRAARNGKDIAITPDGPRGPRHHFKWGALQAARLTGLPIIPCAAAASRSWVFGSWDRFVLPKPFSTIRIVYGSPHFVPRESGEKEMKRIALDLEREMTGLVPLDVPGDDSGARVQ